MSSMALRLPPHAWWSVQEGKLYANNCIATDAAHPHKNLLTKEGPPEEDCMGHPFDKVLKIRSKTKMNSKRMQGKLLHLYLYLDSVRSAVIAGWSLLPVPWSAPFESVNSPDAKILSKPA